MKYREKMKKLKKIITDGILTDESCKFAEKCVNDRRAGEYAKKVLEHIKKYIDIGTKLQELLEKDIVSEDNMDFLEYTANSMYADDRDDTAIILGKCSGERAKKLLFKLAEDRWDVVRSTACTSLISFAGDDVYNFILDRLEKEKDLLTRCYILLALGDICIENNMYNAENLISILTEKEKTAEEREKTTICSILVLLGKKQYTEKIIEQLDDNDPYVRLWNVALLTDILDTDNMELLYEKVKKVYENNEPVAVNEKCKKFFEKYNDLCGL